jgi:hypothetical protein
MLYGWLRTDKNSYNLFIYLDMTGKEVIVFATAGISNNID